MATRVGLSQILLAQLNRPTLQRPHSKRIAYILSLLEAVLRPICVKIYHFSLLCHQGLICTNKRLSDNVQLAYTENPLFSAKCGVI